jgi:hypothetical protein
MLCPIARKQGAEHVHSCARICVPVYVYDVHVYVCTHMEILLSSGTNLFVRDQL